MNKFTFVICALSLIVGCGTEELSRVGSEELHERCNEPGINDFPVEALVEYTYAEDVEYEDGRAQAFMATALIHACTDIQLIAPKIGFIQEHEVEQSPQVPDDATGFYLDANESHAFNSVIPVLDNDQNLEGAMEQARQSDGRATVKILLQDSIPMRAGEGRFISFKVTIARNSALSGSTQKFTMLPGVVYRSTSGVCSGETGCAPNSEVIGTAPTLTVRYQ